MADPVKDPAAARPCGACSSTGALACPACRGAGGEWKSGGGLAACPRCHGAGTVPCEACDGQGMLAGG